MSRIHASSCRISDFKKLLEGFKEAAMLIKQLKLATHKLTSVLLHDIVHKFPNTEQIVEEFQNNFEMTEDEEGNPSIIPKPGTESAYDESEKAISAIKAQLDLILEQQRKFFGDKSVNFKHVGKINYQIEVPIATADKKKLSEAYSVTGETKVGRAKNGLLERKDFLILFGLVSKKKKNRILKDSEYQKLLN